MKKIAIGKSIINFFQQKNLFYYFLDIAWKWQIERVHILIIEYKGNNSESWMGFFKSLFLDRSFQKSWSHNLNGWSSAGRSSLRRCFLVVHDEGEPAWQIDVMLLADGETSVLFVYVYILSVNLRLSGSWDGWWWF